MNIRIMAMTPNGSGSSRRRRATWTGDPGWLSMPPEGANWAHCGEWTGETFRRVWWNGPGGEHAHDIEVEVTVEVLDHLIAEHGFVGGSDG